MRRAVLWGAHPRRATYIGSREDRRVQARRDRQAARRRLLDPAEVARVFDVPAHLVATVNASDLLVLQAERRMSEEEVAQLRAQFRAIPNAPRAMILDESVRLAARVVEENAAEAGPKPFPSPALPCFEDRAFRERWYAERGLTPPGGAR